MEGAYAQALWRVIEGGMVPSKAVHSLRDVLKKHGRETLIPKIAKAFERVAMREIARKTYMVSVAHHKDGESAKSAAKKALESMGVKGAELHLKEDDTLIGGWRLEGGDLLLDASFKKQLLTIYNRATAA